MRQTEERYISLLTDFGFKRIFGTVPNKDLLIDFLDKHTHRVFNDKLTFKYVEIAKFNKSVDELETNCYTYCKTSHALTTNPSIFKMKCSTDSSLKPR